VALVRAMIAHRLHDRTNLAKEESSCTRPGFGFVMLADRAFALHRPESPRLDEAHLFLRQAAELNVPEAFYRLGFALENGIGVERDLVLAALAYAKAGEVDRDAEADSCSSSARACPTVALVGPEPTSAQGCRRLLE
jgi:TPR repeat protein